MPSLCLGRAFLDKITPSQHITRTGATPALPTHLLSTHYFSFAFFLACLIDQIAVDRARLVPRHHIHPSASIALSPHLQYPGIVARLPPYEKRLPDDVFEASREFYSDERK